MVGEGVRCLGDIVAARGEGAAVFIMLKRDSFSYSSTLVESVATFSPTIWTL